MAEGWARHLKGDEIDAYSAGVIAHGMIDRTIQVMKEAGVDISNQYSKSVDELEGQEFDYVITLCDHAAKYCPTFNPTAVIPSSAVIPAKAGIPRPKKPKIIHHPFDDPMTLATDASSEEEALDFYRRVRDEIREFIETLNEAL